MAIIDLQAHIRDPNAHHKPVSAAAGDWQVLAEVEVASDCDYIDITGLDINSDWFYILLATIKNPTASDSDYFLYVEGDYTATNYYHQWIQVYGTSIAANRPNNPSIGYASSGERNLISVIITKDPDGYFRYFSNISRYTSSIIELISRAGSKTAPVTNITSLRVIAEISGAIGAGSKFILAKPRS